MIAVIAVVAAGLCALVFFIGLICFANSIDDDDPPGCLWP